MQVTVELQENFSYIPILLFAAVVVAGIVFFVLWAMKEKTQKEAEQTKTLPHALHRPDSGIKDTYDRKLAELEKQYAMQKISKRRAYQKLSLLLRRFVFEMTGIKVQNYTLQEIRALNQTQLTALIGECYVPEFAPGEEGELAETIVKARKVLREWI